MLSNKTAIITGCNRGIGKAILNLFADKNATIWACSRKEDIKLIEQHKQISKNKNVKIKNIFFDFSNIEEVKLAAKKIVLESEKIDILVNNTGVIDTSLFQMTKIENIKKMFEINFFSQLAFSQILINKMIRNKRGSIINISSTAAIDSNEGRLSYASSKSALLTSSIVLSKELSNFNIRVNVVAPGFTDTDLMKNNHPKNIIDDTLKRISMNRIAQPLEIANVVLFLASDLSSYITGQVLRVDGGMQ